jgi:hypothetical protein
MSFFSFKLRPFFRTLAVIATCFWLSLIIAYVADKATDRSVRETSSAPMAITTQSDRYNDHRRPPTAAELEERKDDQLYGYNYGWSRHRLGVVLAYGDMSLLCDFRSDFMNDMKSSFGDRINRQEMEAPTRDLILTEVIKELTKELRRRGQKDADAIAQTIAEYLACRENTDDPERYRWSTTMKAWKSPEGFWAVTKVTDWKESDQLIKNRQSNPPADEPYIAALNQTPPAFKAYLISLTVSRLDGLNQMEQLLALPPAERKPLEAIAKYRRARLSMNLDDWAMLTDDHAKARLLKIREDLSDVATHARAGSLDPCKISENAVYWIAYTRSIILPASRLVRMGEADFGGAFAAYLKMPMRGEGNAVNSSYRLASRLCDEPDLSAYVHDPDLRRLITLYLAAGGSNNTDYRMSHAEAREVSAAWLDALAKADVDLGFDLVRIAMLQHRTGRWQECLKTTRRLPVDEPMAMLLASRCSLRLNGDIDVSRKILDVAGGAQTTVPVRDLSKAPGHAIPEEDFTEHIELTEKTKLRQRTEGERAMIELAQGRFAEALDFFAKGDYTEETSFVAECVMTIDELKAFVDQRRKAAPAGTTKGPAIDDRFPTKKILASRLFRAGRLEEALDYVSPEIKAQANNYVLFMRLAERTDIADRTKADAYWRAALIVHQIGEEILHASFGLDWTGGGDEGKWYVGYNLLPLKRLQPDSATRITLITSPTKEEALRVQTWLAEHIEKPVRSERDASYAVFDLALKAARSLPHNDPAGGQILQFAGNQLKFVEPKAANPAYVLLATRFKQTPYGEHALKRHWFSKERPNPPADIISK